MAVQDKKVSDLTPLVNVSSDDLLMVVNDPNGSPTSRKIAVGNFLGNVNIDTVFTAGLTANSLTLNGVNVGTGINDRLQVANATLQFNNKIDVSNTLVLLNTYQAQTLQKTSDNIRVNNQNILSANIIQSAIANTFFANTSVSANTFILRGKATDPASSNALNEGISAGSIFYSNTHLYVATDENTIKRVTLSDF